LSFIAKTAMRSDNRPSWKTAYTSFLIFVGLTYVALQPPFEGFDEFAHYSSLRQIAHVGSLPIDGESYLDRETTEYRGPMPYSSGAPPFRGQLGAKSYQEFFSNPADAERYSNYYRTAGRSSRFRESDIPNWQAQHPPLYYAVMTPVVWASDRMSFVNQIFLLRLVSYFLAIGGVLFGLASLNRCEIQRRLPACRHDPLCRLLLGCLLN